MSEMKPCPVCREAARLFKREDNGDWCVECPNGDCIYVEASRCKSADAVTAWNARAPDPLTERLVVEALRALYTDPNAEQLSNARLFEASDALRAYEESKQKESKT